MLAENRTKFADFQMLFYSLDKTWERDKISFEGNDIVFTAMYEPDFPMPSDRDRIVVYNVANRHYMLFLRYGSGCVVNTKEVSDIKSYLLQCKLDSFRGTQC